MTSKGRVNWRCFHCDETFRSRDEAREHFGPTELSNPACAIDVAEYRRMEAEIARRAEDTDLPRALYAEQAKLTPAVRRAEEQGYERGLADGRKLSDETPGGFEASEDVQHLSLALVQQEGVLNECELLLREALDEDGVNVGFDDRLEAYWVRSEALADWRSRDALIESAPTTGERQCTGCGDTFDEHGRVKS